MMRLIDADALRILPEEYRGKKVVGARGSGKTEQMFAVWILMKVQDQIDEAKTVDAVEIVRCKECRHRGSPYSCPMRKMVMPISGPGTFEDCTEDEGYCHRGERRVADEGDLHR